MYVGTISYKFLTIVLILFRVASRKVCDFKFTMEKTEHDSQFYVFFVVVVFFLVLSLLDDSVRVKDKSIMLKIIHCIF